jgi:hypothetical protein
MRSLSDTKSSERRVLEAGIALGIFYRAGFDNFTTFYRDLANFARKSPSQSGYCRTSDGREGQDNSGDGWGQNTDAMGVCTPLLRPD